MGALTGCVPGGCGREPLMVGALLGAIGAVIGTLRDTKPALD